MTSPLPRVTAIDAPETYQLPARPQQASAAVMDAYRQTQFMLSGDLELFAEAMNLQVRLITDARPVKYRTHELAAITALWSRTYGYLSDTALLVTRGSYPSTLPLVRAACEAIAAQVGLRGGEMGEHAQWLASTLEPNEEFKAFEFELGRYFPGSVLANDAVLRGIYRPASDLGRPAFGASLLQVGPESNNNRLSVTFADASFHLGWAELTLGWLIALALRQIQVIIDAEGVFPVSDEVKGAYNGLRERIEKTLANGDRCKVEEVVRESDRRYLVHNFRRSAGGAPKRIVL
jgi:hypothetical protein